MANTDNGTEVVDVEATNTVFALLVHPEDELGHPYDCTCPLCDSCATLLDDSRRDDFDSGMQFHDDPW